MKMMMIYCSKLSTSPGRKASQKSPPLLDPNSIPNSHSSPGAGGSISSKVSQGLEARIYAVDLETTAGSAECLFVCLERALVPSFHRSIVAEASGTEV